MTSEANPYRDDERLRKEERLLERRAFLAARKRGRRTASDHFIVYARPNDRRFSRLGITASTKVGPATTRNWWKRRIREIFRRNKRRFPSGFDFVVIVRSSRRRPPTDELCDELLEAFGQGADATEE